MEGAEVLVIGETPSLGRAIADLLESSDLAVRYARDVATEVPLENFAGRFPVVVAASTGLACATARRWSRGELPGAELVVVGERDATVSARDHLHFVSLPLRPQEFLELVRRLLSVVAHRPSSTGSREEGHSSPAGRD
jgi:hypothetical protein